MANQAKTGKGTKFYVNGVLVGARTKISISGRKCDTPESTDMDSPVDTVSGVIMKEYIVGLGEGGTFDVDANFVPGDAGQSALWAAYGNVAAYQVLASDGSWSFSANGIVDSGPDIDFEQSKPMGFKVKVKITGNVTTVGF